MMSTAYAKLLGATLIRATATWSLTFSSRSDEGHSLVNYTHIRQVTTVIIFSTLYLTLPGQHYNFLDLYTCQITYNLMSFLFYTNFPLQIDTCVNVEGSYMSALVVARDTQEMENTVQSMYILVQF